MDIYGVWFQLCQLVDIDSFRGDISMGGDISEIWIGTAADHHVHHKFFKYNFGHLFMWFDWMAGTYRDPREVWGKEFNVGV